MATPVLLRHPSSLEHDTGPHPENASRIEAIERILQSRDWAGWDMRESPAAPGATLELIHPAEHVEAIEVLAARGGASIDMDTIVSRGSFEAARRAAGGATAMVDALLTEDVVAGASLHRPPGHHATRDTAMGFCLFNNIAIAAQHALEVHDVGRVMIFDWDVHHGNGTNDIFHAAPEVLFCSIHQSPMYPGTGPAADIGSGDGAGYTVNLPVPGGTGDDVWCSLTEHVVADLARSYEPGLILVSAGFDAHADDPLGGCRVTDQGFAAMAATMRGVATELGVPLGMVLEGGYDVDALARSVLSVLEVFGTSRAPRVHVERHALADEARARLASGAWAALA